MKRESIDRARELEVFVAIVEAGGVSAGGRRVGISPSAASRTLQSLEGRLGVRLATREGRAFRLTTEGENYYQAGRRILRDLAEMEQTLGDQAAPRGKLRVSSTIAFGRIAILPHLGAFQDMYPKVAVELSLSDHMADLAAGEADVAVRVGDLPDSDLKARKLGESPRVVVASPDYLARCGTPKRPEELERHNCLRFSFRAWPTTWPFRHAEGFFDVAVDGNIEVDNGDALVQLALAGHGIARAGRFHVQGEIEAGRLVPLLEKYDAGETESFHAVFPGGSKIPGRVRAFVDFVAARVGRW